ncbi:hypothetical protein BDZ89DRAFT_1110963 [Hymenopellis radicata]|nr:hypothetical protein BDZ89DRAFT_1110963 [Hymenopellis radicata]
MSGNSAGGRRWLASCGQYNTVIPSVHYPTTVIFISEEPKLPFETVCERILYQRRRVFTRHMPSRISQLPEAELTAQQLHSFKWTVRVIDLCVADSPFFIVKEFSHSDAPCDLPISERHDILQSEPWIQRDSVRANGVRCAGCTRKIEFEHTYSVLEWVAHRDICQGIEHKMMQAMFVDWADATDDEDVDPAELIFDRSYHQTFEYPLRYVRLPEYALDEVDIDGDSDDEEYFADDCDGASYSSSEDLHSDLDERSSVSNPVGEVDALVQKAGLGQLFYAKESQDQIFALGEALKRAAQAGLDVFICPEGEEPDFKIIVTECFSPADEEEFIPLGPSYSDSGDEEDDSASETSSIASNDDEDCGSSNDGSFSSISSIYSNLENDEDGFPRWYSAEAYHPGYYDGSDDDEDDDVEEDEEDVRYISYEEHLRLWAKKHPELAQNGVDSEPPVDEIAVL